MAEILEKAISKLNKKGYLDIDVDPTLDLVEEINKVAEYLNVNVNTEFKYINNPKNPEQKSLIERNVLSLRDIPARLVYFPSFSINGTKSTSKFAEERKLELNVLLFELLYNKHHNIQNLTQKNLT